MKLKELMDQGVDVGELYTKVADMVSIMERIEEEEIKIRDTESSIRELLELTDRDYQGLLKVDMMNGTTLVIEDEIMYMEMTEDE